MKLYICMTRVYTHLPPVLVSLSYVPEECHARRTRTGAYEPSIEILDERVSHPDKSKLTIIVRVILKNGRNLVVDLIKASH